MASLTGRIEGIIGTGVPDVAIAATLDMALCGYGSTIPRANGTALLGRLTEHEITVDSSGNFGPITFFGNDEITPSGTYYTITVRDENGDIAQVNAYQFVGNNVYDLTTLNPFDPSFPPPPLVPPALVSQLLFVGYSSIPNFPGDVYASWQITLTGDAAPTFTNLIDGVLYTLRVLQDAVGGHAFTWPSNVTNAAPVDPNPDSSTIQTFMAVSGNLYPIAAATYYP